MKDAQWDDLKTVMAMVRHGSLAAAGQALGVNYTTVARRIARAEAALGTPLFDRLADGYRPTEEALIVAARADAMAREEDAMMRQLAGRDGRLTGRLVVTAPQLVIAHAIAPAIETFVAAHPDVDLDVRATNDMLDLTRREADLAIRISRDPGDTLKGLRLAEQTTASFAAPKWAEVIAQDPEATLPWVVYSGHPHVPAGVAERHPNAQVRYRFDDMVALAGAAEAGLGVARLPMFIGRGLKGLVQVPCLPPQPYADIWMVAHADVWGGAKVTAFRTVLRDWFRANRGAFVA